MAGGRGNSGLGGKTGIRVDLKHPGLTGFVHTEIHPRIAGEAEHPGAFPAQPLKLSKERLISAREGEGSPRAVIILGALGPLGGIAHHPFTGRCTVPGHLGGMQHLHAACAMQQRDIELPTGNESLSEHQSTQSLALGGKDGPGDRRIRKRENG